MTSTQNQLIINPPPLRNEPIPTSSQEIKEQIDSILQNDFAVLNKNPSVSHHALLTKHNNPLLLTYVKHIYHQYNLKDPLPQHSASKLKSQPEGETQINTSIKRKKSKLHLYSSQAPPKFMTPLREQNRGSEHLKTEPTRKPLSLGPSSLSKDQIQNELTLKKQFVHNETTLKASNSYFQLKSAEQSFFNGYNQHSTFIEPDRINLSVSRKYEKGKEMRIETQEPFENIDQGIEIHQFTLPLAPSLPPQFIKDVSLDDLDAKLTITEPRTLVSNKESFFNKNQHSGQNLHIQGAEVAQSRLMMPYPLPQIIKTNSPQVEQINQNFRYCIGCQKALLEANIHVHQKRCKEFKRVLELSPTQIIEHLKSKIRKFEANIQQYSEQLLKIDPSQLGQHSQKIFAESRSILGDGQLTKTYEREYSQVVQISRRWCLMTEQINKVNWFLKIRERVKKQLQI